MDELVFTPSDFVAVFNQTLEYAYPSVVIEGELANFRVSKNRWLYFSLQDENASLAFFGSVYQLPGPLQDGLKVRAVGMPKMHPRFGFSINITSITPVGEGSLKKAADLLAKKLAAEGLFAPERKRLLPAIPGRIGLITAAGSAAAADFIKILNERWGGLEITLVDTYVQGEQAPLQLVEAIELLNKSSNLPEILVITRGGGSADDLAAFNDERVVRAVAASRIPTLVAIGHEIDFSLAELAADVRASTPSNAAQILVPDKHHELAKLKTQRLSLSQLLLGQHQTASRNVGELAKLLAAKFEHFLDGEKSRLKTRRQLLLSYDPRAALRRGYAIISKNGRNISRIGQVAIGDKLSLQLSDGTVNAKVVGRG